MWQSAAKLLNLENIKAWRRFNDQSEDVRLKGV
jgi:hypothetical protein